MENLVKETPKSEIYGITIDDSFIDYRNDKFFLKKLDEANKLIARIGLPPEFYERRAVTYEDVLASAEPLASASEPQAEYGVPKDTEK